MSERAATVARPDGAVAGRLHRGPLALAYARAAALPWTVPTLIAITAVGAVVRLVNFNAVGYNSDEAVYAGQARLDRP